MRIVQQVGNDRSAFDALMQVFLNDEYRVVQRAAWAIGYCLEAHPSWAAEYLPALLANLKNPAHDAVKRNIVRALQQITIPDTLAGEAADILFQFVGDPKEPVAVRCFSMTALFNLCQDEPDLLAELRLILEDVLENEGTGGLLARGRKVLLQIAKIEKARKSSTQK